MVEKVVVRNETWFDAFSLHSRDNGVHELRAFVTGSMEIGIESVKLRLHPKLG